MKNRTLPLSMARNAVLSILLLAVAGFANLHAQPQGAINGLFSVSECRQVYFSQGNLQYQASTGTWRFAENQYTYVGANNSNISPAYNDWIDLFCWGTSGYDHGAVCYQPWCTSEDYSGYYAYGQKGYNLYDQTGQADWGYNVISNGGNIENSGWRTLTRQEWNYLFCTRSGSRYALARVNNVNGVIILPDDWNSSYYSLSGINNSAAAFTNNTITAANWTTLEQYGAVFLPAAGQRSGSTINNVNTLGYYWTSSQSHNSHSHSSVIYFQNKNAYFATEQELYQNRYFGLSVRLACNTIQKKIFAKPNPAVGGSVSGMNAYDTGEECTLEAIANNGYVFVNWTEEGEVVSTNAIYSFTVTRERSLVANFISSSTTITNGALNGQFSVSANEQVYFSQGNLQYIGSAAAPYWKFAEHQWDYLGDNGQDCNLPTKNRDLFVWGSSGYEHGAICYQPWDITYYELYGPVEPTNYFAYGQHNRNLNDLTGQADWGYNAISNGGNEENCGWRTLTQNEWEYLFNTRSTSSGIRYAKARVNNVNGMILLPDDWSSSFYTLSNTNQNNAAFTTNVISIEWWNVLEQHGAVFLPAAGYRGSYFGSSGVYMSSSYYDANNIYNAAFGSSSFSPNSHDYYRNLDCSVRLVFSDHSYSYSPTINATSNPAEGGQVNGGGVYEFGTECTLTAIANTGYAFLNWTKDGEVVSTEATYSFTTRYDKDLVANFVYSDVSHENGVLSGRFTVNANKKQVLFSQGNLQYIGEADTTYWKFAEHQWDYLGGNCQNNNLQKANRDLFGWGTSGYAHGATCYQPWSTATNAASYYAYGQVGYGLYNQDGRADWGYNPISNGGDQENCGWYTLLMMEWDYMIKTRSTASGIRYAKAIVNNINGLILLPDDWDPSYYALENTNEANAGYSTNVITATQWKTLEQHGAVFLPAAGYRSGTNVMAGQGRYWSSQRYVGASSDNDKAFLTYFTNNTLEAYTYYTRYLGHAVRLVRNAPCDISVVSNPVEGGSIAGIGTYEYGANATVTATANTGFVFVNWMENGVAVSTNASYSFTVTADRILVANFRNANAGITNGMLNGHFSVGDYEQIQFSQGNLQYIGSVTPRYWKFAEHQWDCFGDNGQGSALSNVNRDLFGWGTSGYAHGATCYQPWSTNDDMFGEKYLAYGQAGLNLYDESGKADWGYNAISNGGNQENNGWRTPTKEEWVYMFNTRNTVSGIRYAKACINNINGVILLPDEWNASYYPLNNTNVSNAAFESNTISAVQWNTLEQHGAVFLPASGCRLGTEVFTTMDYSDYWSSSSSGSDIAYCLEFNSYSSGVLPDYTQMSVYGLPVRLIRPAQNYYYGINATPSPIEGGTVSGGGGYMEGEVCTLTATPNPGYIFTNWTWGSTVVSTDATYSFTVFGNKTLVANFEPITNHWTPEIGEFEDYMALTCVIQIDGVEQHSEYLEVGSFCGNQCRGSMRAVYWTTIPELNRYVVYLQIYGQNGESIDFRLFDHSLNQELDLTSPSPVTWTTNTISYHELNPYILNFTSTVDISAIVNPVGAGTVTGTGGHAIGSTCTLSATANVGFRFKNWTLGGTTVSTEAIFSFTVTGSASYTANFEYVHSQALANGWNWWSTYIELNGSESLTMLENSLGNNADQIKSWTDGYVNRIEYLGYVFWSGGLSSIYNDEMYIINANQACVSEIAGEAVSIENTQINLNPGWNWIGFPGLQNQSVLNALTQFDPQPNDMIKGRNGYASYITYGSYSFWSGALNTLEPGHGYKYYSNSNTSKTVTYNTVRETSSNATPNYGECHYTPSSEKYAYNMTVTAVIDMEGKELRSDDYEVAAFVGNECRGSAKLMYVEPLDRYLAFLLVFGEMEESVSFVLTDGKSENWSDIHITYTNDGMVGTVYEPFVLNFGSLVMSDVTTQVNVYPNPSNGMFNIESKDMHRIEILDSNGHIVLSKEIENDHTVINLNKESRGIYLLRVITSNDIETIKLFKK